MKSLTELPFTHCSPQKTVIVQIPRDAYFEGNTLIYRTSGELGGHEHKLDLSSILTREQKEKIIEELKTNNGITLMIN